MDRSRSSPGTPHVEETPSLYDMHAWPNEMINFCAPHAAVYMLYKKYSQDGFTRFTLKSAYAGTIGMSSWE